MTVNKGSLHEQTMKFLRPTMFNCAHSPYMYVLAADIAVQLDRVYNFYAVRKRAVSRHFNVLNAGLL